MMFNPTAEMSAPVADSDRTHGAKRTNDPAVANFVNDAGGAPMCLSSMRLPRKDGSLRWKRGANSSPLARADRWPWTSSMTRPSVAAAAPLVPSFCISTCDSTAAQLR